MKKRIIVIFLAALVGISVGMSLLLNNLEEPVASIQREEVDLKKMNEELAALSLNVMQSLNDDYEGIGDILFEYQKSFTIQTSLDSADSNSKQIAMNIQKSVEDVFNTGELESISTGSYKIIVESKDGTIIN